MKNLVLIAILILGQQAISQSVIYQNDFDSYVSGFAMGAGTIEWETWSGGLNDEVFVTSQYSHSPSNSIFISDSDDILYFFGGMDSGKYRVSFYFYVPSGSGMYFNLMHSAKLVFANEIWMNDSGSLWFQNGIDTLKIGTCAFDVWQNFAMEIDLNNDSIHLLLDGNHLESFPFSTSLSGKDPSLVLDVINFFGINSVVAPFYEITSANFYVDDFLFETMELTGISENETQSLSVYPNPTSGRVSVDLSGMINPVEFVIRNSVGHVVFVDHPVTNGLYNIEIQGARGVYFLEIISDNQPKKVVRVIKN